MTHEKSAPPPSTPPAPGDDPSPEKKERVLHTRIPAVLEGELKAAAAALRVPVSNLVRSILEDAVAIADRATGRVEDHLSRAARSVHDERTRLRERVERLHPLADVVAYQPVVVAAATECARCAASLAPGEPAGLAVRSRPGPPLFVCDACVPKPP